MGGRSGRDRVSVGVVNGVWLHGAPTRTRRTAPVLTPQLPHPHRCYHAGSSRSAPRVRFSFEGQCCDRRRSARRRDSCDKSSHAVVVRAALVTGWQTSTPHISLLNFGCEPRVLLSCIKEERAMQYVA